VIVTRQNKSPATPNIVTDTDESEFTLSDGTVGLELEWASKETIEE
jgi:hypothetical protein